MKWIRDLWHGWTWLDLRSGTPLETGTWFFTQSGADRDARLVQQLSDKGRLSYLVVNTRDADEVLAGWTGDQAASRLSPEEIQAAAELGVGESMTLSSGVRITRRQAP